MIALERSAMTRSAALCIGLPGTLVIAGLGAWLVASCVGLPWVGAGDTVTLPEAAMMADHADVVRLIARGGDPNAPARVRSGTIDLAEHRISPLEAATRSRQAGILQLLVDSGARITGGNFPMLWCSATRTPNNEAVIAFLDSHRPAGVPAIECAHVQTP
jgi:hypothetical protein